MRLLLLLLLLLPAACGDLPQPFRGNPGRMGAQLAVPLALRIAVPPPPEFALDPIEIEKHILQALAQAEAAGIRGQAVTPFLLSAVMRETSGESMRTNMALLENNARVAAAIAVALYAV